MFRRADPKVAFVIDALPSFRGAERVLAAALEQYPGAPIYTLVHEPSAFAKTSIEGRSVHTSWIQRLPGGKAHYRALLPLLPIAIERFDLSGYDIIISFSYAVAHGIRCRPDQLHIGYTFTPLRYAWQDADKYFQDGLLAPLSQLVLRQFRAWDMQAAARVDHFVAISQWTATCIRRAYGRESEVIYPPVDLARFTPLEPRGNYYAVLSRLVRHKNLELIVESFSRLGLPLLVLGDGPERKKLEGRAAPNVKFVGAQSDGAAAELLGRAKGLVHAAQEDFGLVLAEAQAAGCPVIAYRGGAAAEIIVDGTTGLLYREQTIESLTEALSRFEAMHALFRPEAAISNARRFSRERFSKEIGHMVEREWSGFVRQRDGAAYRMAPGSRQSSVAERTTSTQPMLPAVMTLAPLSRHEDDNHRRRGDT